MEDVRIRELARGGMRCAAAAMLSVVLSIGLLPSVALAEEADTNADSVKDAPAIVPGESGDDANNASDEAEGDEGAVKASESDASGENAVAATSVEPTTVAAGESGAAPAAAATITNARTGVKYTDLATATAEAQSGDTIKLGEGNYTLYKVSSEGHTKGKDLTFEGLGADKTAWNIGALVPDPANYGTEYNGDYSFDGAGTVTFKNMTLRSGSANYLGFIRADKTVVDGCVVNGKTFYWGYTSAEFKGTTFNAPSGDYALWTYSSPTMTFDACTFNASGKVINVYTDYGAGKQDITVNVNNCTFNSKALLGLYKQALNINDSNMGNYKYILNITGSNKVTAERDNTTCSQLFGFGGKSNNNTGRADVSIDGELVWSGGKMLTHGYTDGQHEDNFVDLNDYVWEQKADGWYCTGHAKCGYCNWPIEETVKATVEVAPATCTEPGKTAYTATFTHKCFQPQTKSEESPALNHDWGEPVYTWAQQDDGWYCSAKRICKRDASHVEEETVKAAYEVTTPATTDKVGEGTYTATFENEAFKPQTKVEEIAKLSVTPTAPGQSSESSASSDDAGSSLEKDSSQSELAKTADANGLVIPVSLAVAAGAAFCLCFAARRRKDC